MTDAVWVDDFSKEEEALQQLLMRPGLRVFVGKREGNRARTDIMAGGTGVPWFRAISCVGADHSERATRYVAAYYQAHPKGRKAHVDGQGG